MKDDKKESVKPMAKHTQGTWHVTDDGSEVNYSSGIFGGLICTMAPDFTDEAEQRANAKLIAAAPQLLASLKALHTHLDKIFAVDININEEDLIKAKKDQQTAFKLIQEVTP